MNVPAFSFERLALLATFAVTACAVAPFAPPDEAVKVPVPSAVEDAPSALADSMPPPSTEVTPARPMDARKAFSTRHAHFQPAHWNDIPGWRDDDLAGVWEALRKSCIPLGRRDVWRDVCSRSAGAGADVAAQRAFFEREFEPYEVRNVDRSRDGVITGYYEPLIAGRRTREGGFVYPVYGVPSDLLTLDTRLVPKARRTAPVPVRVDGNRVIPVLDGGVAPYVLDFGEAQAGTLDKRMRVRRVGSRIVPYPTRSEIEREGLPRARVLAWVDNAAALYSMQIQGSGRIRLEDGQTLRLAYAEQNGHPFRPPVSRRTRSLRSSSIFARGLEIDFETVANDLDFQTGESTGAAVSTRGLSPSGQASKVLEADIERLVEALASGQVLGEVAPPRPAAQPAARPGASAAARPKPPPSVAATPPVGADRTRPAVAGRVASQQSPQAMQSTAVMRFPQPGAGMLAAILSDPSYVFFRSIPDGPDGPLGALGVPLTAGRSVAVDPRTTPLGFPVFISTTKPGGAEALNQLMMAQDTGGAIRGAVRADYFWGLGGSAFAQAARMKERGRLWLLLPRGLELAARDRMMRTRGAGAAGAPDCVVPDEELCVEDVE